MHIDRTRTVGAKGRTISRRTARNVKLARALFPCATFPPFLARALAAPAQIEA